MNKSESKYFNTANKIDEAFISLLNEKDFDYITVKEICQMADVNRSTFYLHYENIGDLLQESIEYINRKCFDRFEKKSIDKIEESPLEELIFITPEFLVPYLEFIKENKVLFKTAVTKSTTLNSTKTFEQIFKDIIAPILKRFNFNDDEFDYIIAFYINGLIAIVMQWLKNDCKDDVEKVMKIIINVTIPNGNKVFSLEKAKEHIEKNIIKE